MARKRQYTLNENFFETINTAEKAYWLGFIFADGYITKRKQGQDVLGIRLGELEPLELFSKSIGTNKPVRIYISHSGYNVDKAYYLQTIISTKLVADLERYGCIQRKSLVLQFPKISQRLEPHFIRGYFDGDGSVFIHKVKDWQSLGVSICGTQEFLFSIKAHLPFLTDKDKCIYKDNRRATNTWQLKLLSQKRCKAFYEYLYSDATIYMDRKKQIFENFRPISIRKYDRHGRPL
jgi:hypothetical protein